MTTLTTVLGLIPMAVGWGRLSQGAELRQPMAVTVIGGLLFSTLLTLVLIPVLYDLIDRKKFAVDGEPSRRQTREPDLGGDWAAAGGRLDD